MFRIAIIGLVLVTSAPAFAASDAVCKDFVDAMKKASKLAGKEMAADDAAFWMKQCQKPKNIDEEVKKQTACLNKAKTDKDLGACLK